MFSLNPDLFYTGNHERDDNPIDSINTQIDFTDVLSRAAFTRSDLGKAWDRKDIQDWSITRPFGENASLVLANNATVDWS